MTAAPGTVIWITGLSGAGKTSIAQALVELLGAAGDQAVLVDGDAVREIVGDPGTGHDHASRVVNAMRICRMTRFLSLQGFTVVVATMSLFREIHAWNRSNLPSYFEVYVKVRLDVLKGRDARGLYSRAARGEAQDVVGVHLAFDEPREPDLVCVNDHPLDDLKPLARQILAALKTQEKP